MYVRRVRSAATPAVVPFLDAYLRHQQDQFVAAAESLVNGLSYISAGAIREHISRAVTEVVVGAA